jgi:hypothetical protein
MSKQQIKLCVPGGWSTAAREHMVDLWETRKLPFIDRAGVADRTLLKSGIQVIKYKEGMKLPDEYVFFGHRGMDDLPHNITLNRGT